MANGSYHTGFPMSEKLEPFPLTLSLRQQFVAARFPSKVFPRGRGPTTDVIALGGRDVVTVTEGGLVSLSILLADQSLKHTITPHKLPEYDHVAFVGRVIGCLAPRPSATDFPE